MTRPTPKHRAPDLKFPLINGGQWELTAQHPDHFTLVVFYRGLHCPLCKKYLKTLEELLPEFTERGVNVVAVSMDTEKRARIAHERWAIPNLTLGFGLAEEAAKNWGLYMSKAVKDGEPDLFSEPGLFLVDNNNDVYYSAINSNPWGRPYLPSFVKAVDYIIKSGYPARGEVL